MIKNLIILLILIPVLTYPQEHNYDVALISDALKNNAKAVVRKDLAEFTIRSPKDATFSVTYAITILNENAIDQSYFIEFYDRFRKVNEIKAIVFDANGKKVKRIPNDEILDISAISGFSIYEDNRLKAINPRYRTVPFTVEYSYSINYNGILNFPNWYFYSYYNVSVEHSQLKINVPKDYKFRYYERNLSSRVKKYEDEKSFTFIWDTTNLPAIKEEPFSLPFEEYIPAIYLGPSDFELDSYAGNLDNWENFGKWIKQLNNDRDELPIETQNSIKDQIKDIDNDFDKIKAIYSFLQNKTRYVSIQIGIGGYQPFEASLVDKMSYGDCKALTNYMKSLLEVAGINSNYCLVMAGTNVPRLIKDFSSSQFNHAFLCVPLMNDTVWLECTNQIIPCGYIGDFTDDRDVLLINENGGKIVHTKIYTVEENIKSNKVLVNIDNTGNATAIINTDYKGLFYEDIIPIIISDDSDKKKKLYNRINIPNIEISQFSHKVTKSRIPVVNENIHLYIRNCGTLMGDRMVLNLNLMNIENDLPKRVADRKSDILIRRSFTEIDTIIYKIPDQYTLNKVPADGTITSEYGIYKTHVDYNNDEIRYVRSFTLNKGTYHSSDYEKFVSFFESVLNSDMTKIVLQKSN